MDQQDYLEGVIVDVGDNLMNESTHDAPLQTRVDDNKAQLQPAGRPYARLIAATFNAHFNGAQHNAAV